MKYFSLSRMWKQHKGILSLFKEWMKCSRNIGKVNQNLPSLIHRNIATLYKRAQKNPDRMTIKVTAAQNQFRKYPLI